MITIIDYNSGNIASVWNALEKIGQEAVVSSDPAVIAEAEKVIFPGVGRAGFAMEQLRKQDLVEVIRDLEVPFLGICMGLQLLTDFSEEDDTECLSIIPGEIKKFDEGLSVPQIGWNRVEFVKDSPLFRSVESGSYVYFVNSFYFDGPAEYVLGKTEYGKSFGSVLQKENFYATQFHPEKSGETGLKLLRNFCELC